MTREKWRFWNWKIPMWIALSNGEIFPGAVEWMAEVRTTGLGSDWHLIIDQPDFVAAIYAPAVGPIHLAMLRKEA